MVIQYKTVINKEINYSDTVLPLKELGTNLKITTLENIEESELETCLKLIVEENPQVIFNTIQYSKNNKKVIFYTDKDIQTKAYTDSKRKEYQPLSTTDIILNEINKVMSLSDSEDTTAISLYEVIKLMKDMSLLYEKKEHDYDDAMNSKVRNKINSNSRITIYGYDSKEKILNTSFRFSLHGTYDKINFSKYNGDLHIKSSDSIWDKEVLSLLGDELSKLYDNLKALDCFKNQNNYRLQAINSNFLINICNYMIKIYTIAPDNEYQNEFQVFYRVLTDEYDCECNSYKLISTIKGHEDKLFKKVFVAIPDCPRWMQPKLTEIRNKQLKNNCHDSIVEENVEKHQVKKRTLFRKIFPFLKK